MKMIPLTRGMVALVDDADFETLSRRKWYAMPCSDGRCYAARTSYTGGRKRTIRMHRELMEIGPGEHVDHIDGSGLNNQKANIRRASRSENGRNRRKQTAPTTSRYKGVTWNRWGWQKKWRAQINLGHSAIKTIGGYATEVEAALAYDAAARLHFGAFAKVNFPEVAR